MGRQWDPRLYPNMRWAPCCKCLQHLRTAASPQTEGLGRHLRCHKTFRTRRASRAWRRRTCPRQIRIEERSSCSQGKPKRDSEFRDRPGTEFLPAHWEIQGIDVPGKAPESRYEYRIEVCSSPSECHNLESVEEGFSRYPEHTG